MLAVEIGRSVVELVASLEIPRSAGSATNCSNTIALRAPMIRCSWTSPRADSNWCSNRLSRNPRRLQLVLPVGLSTAWLSWSWLPGRVLQRSSGSVWIGRPATPAVFGPATWSAPGSLFSMIRGPWFCASGHLYSPASPRSDSSATHSPTSGKSCESLPAFKPWIEHRGRESRCPGTRSPTPEARPARSCSRGCSPRAARTSV